MERGFVFSGDVEPGSLAANANINDDELRDDVAFVNKPRSVHTVSCEDIQLLTLRHE
jgi:hypothetical protein